MRVKEVFNYWFIVWNCFWFWDERGVYEIFDFLFIKEIDFSVIINYYINYEFYCLGVNYMFKICVFFKFDNLVDER